MKTFLAILIPYLIVPVNLDGADFAYIHRDIPDFAEHRYQVGAIYPPPFSWWRPEPLTFDYLLERLIEVSSRPNITFSEIITYRD